MANDVRSLRIAVTGSASTGRTALAAALSEHLGLPLVREEVREHLEAVGRRLASEPPARAAEGIRALWLRCAESEERLGSFVADSCSFDLAAYALHHGAPAALFDQTAFAGEAARRYDALFLLPPGALPSLADGVRADDPGLELRYQLLLEGLLARCADPRRVHRLPASCTTLSGRLAWVLARVRGAQRDPQKEGAAARVHRGFVYFVGAGPGDPDLLTVRALELVRSAQVIAHDELVPGAILSLADPRAELVSVGRRHHGASRQPLRLHPHVLARAAAGQIVVRLKCGDPLVFGRGGEEMEELAQAGIPFRVVPGISAALGAAASAHIPLTHREHSSDVTFATGHDMLGCRSSRSDWGRLAGSGTLVLYMAARSLGSNLARLVELGRPASTPAAWIESATRPDEKIIVGTIADLAAQVKGNECGGPALVIVGEVVAVRARLGEALVPPRSAPRDVRASGASR